MKKTILVHGQTEISLPTYINCLSDIIIRDLKKIDCKNVIIACGYHRNSQRIVFLNENFDIFEVDPFAIFQKRFEILYARPIGLGLSVEIRAINSIIEVDVDDIMSSSNPIDLSQLEIDINHENKPA